jgi:hypothetical protein
MQAHGAKNSSSFAQTPVGSPFGEVRYSKIGPSRLTKSCKPDHIDGIVAGPRRHAAPRAAGARIEPHRAATRSSQGSALAPQGRAWVPCHESDDQDVGPVWNTIIPSPAPGVAPRVALRDRKATSPAVSFAR